MNKPIHRTDYRAAYPFPLLSKHELKRYPTITDIAGHSLRVDEQGVLFGSRKTIGPPPSRESIDFCKTLLEKALSIRTPTINSYSAKGQFERLERSGHLFNGSLIVASYELGIRQLWLVDTPNTRIALSRKWFREYLAGPSMSAKDPQS
jgi:hypothetical protein